MDASQYTKYIDFVTFLLLILCALGSAGTQEPTLEVIRTDEPAYPGVPYTVEYQVRWQGAADQFAIGPPSVGEVSWGDVTVRESVSSVEDGMNVVSQFIEFTADEPGEHEVPEVTIVFFSPEAAAPPETDPDTVPPDPETYPSLRAAPFPVTVYPDRSPLWFSGGLGALLLFVAAATYTYKRRLPGARTKPVTASPPDIRALRDRLQVAQRLRLDGDFYAFLRILTEVVDNIKPVVDTNRLLESLRDRAQEVGFKGVRPTDDELESILRDVHRALNAADHETRATPSGESLHSPLTGETSSHGNDR